MEGQRMMMEGQMQVPVAPQPLDQPGLLSASHIPPSAVSQRMPMKVRPPVMGGGGYGPPHEGLAYGPPMDYMQRQHHNQPCHISAKPYYGQAPYHGQQILLNPHASPPAAQHQPYFRPGRGGPAGTYPKAVQGSSHGWGDYRVKLDQMQMYGPNQQYTNPALYVNPTPVDPRIPEFVSPMGVPAALEGQRFGSPTHGYPSAPGYYGAGQPVQQYPPYMIPGKPWHPGSEQAMQRTMVEPPYKTVHPVNSVGEPGFPKHPGALSPVAVGASKLPQTYIPGKRLEHFSPGIQGCGGPTMLSPRQSAECLEEFPAVKAPMVIHGSGHPPEFPNRHCVVYGQMVSPGGQYRPAGSQRTVDIGGLQQGVYGSKVYGQQGYVDGPPTPTPRCHYPYSKQFQSPHFYPYTGTKCESDGAGQFYGGQESPLGATTIASVGQNQICREPMVYGSQNPETAENPCSTTSHLHAGHFATTLSDATLTTVANASSRYPNSVLSPSLERIMSLSGARIDEQRGPSILQTTSSVSVSSSFHSSSSSAAPETGLVRSNPVAKSAYVSTDTVASLGNTKESVTCFDNLQPSTPGLVRTDVGRSHFVTIKSSSNYPTSFPTTTGVDTSCAVVTQTVSTSTTVAMTVSTAASVSRHCSLASAGVEVLASQSGREAPSSSPCHRGESWTWSSKLSSDNRGVDFKEFSGVIALPTPLQSPVRASPGEIRDQLVKTEPMFASPRCRVPRARKKKTKLNTVVVFPKAENRLLSIKLEEPGEAILEGHEVSAGTFEGASSLVGAKPGLDYTTKELCLEVTALTNRILPLPKDPSPGNTTTPCLEKAEAGDVKEQAAKTLVTVPFGWKRSMKDGRVVYHSPTSVELESLDQIRQYLLKEGTCKCGLQCPLVVEKVFVFDAAVESRHLCADDVRCDMDLTNLCNHKRKIVAMATFQHSAGLQMNLIDGMQFRGLPSTSGATPLRSPSVGFEGGTEFSSAAVGQSGTLAVKFPHAGSESLAASSRKIQQGCFPGGATAFGRNPVGADGRRSVDEEGFGMMEPKKWPTKVMESPGMPGNGSYLSRNCGLPAGAPRGAAEHQHLDLPMSSPRQGNPNQHQGGFPMESPGFRFMQNAGPPHGVPSGYGPGRPMWPPYEETRFLSSQHARPGAYGSQARFRGGGGEMMWPFRQQMHRGRVGPHAAQPFSGYPMMNPEETGDLTCGGRSFELESHPASFSPASDLWGQSTATAPGAKSVRKARKKTTKKEKPYSSILEKGMPCPNIDVRQIIQEQQERIQVEASANTSCHQLPPSAVITPSSDHLATFLAQQTVLVNRSLPGNLGGCSSPADDSDATQSVSTIYGSADDVGSCQTLSGSSPLFGIAPPTPSQTEKKSCDDGDSKARTFSSSGDTSLDSVSHGSVFSSCLPMAAESASLSSDRSAVLASPAGQPGSSEMGNVTTMGDGRGFTRSAAERGFCNADRGIVSAFCSSSDQSNVLPGSGMPSFQLRPTLTPGSGVQRHCASMSDLGIMTHQQPVFSFNSNASHAGYPPNFSSSSLSSNPLHSRNQFYFSPRNTVPYACTTPGLTNRNMLLLGPPEMSGPCRSEQYMARLVPDSHPVMKPAPSSLTSGAGSQATEPFAHVPFEAAAGGGVPALQRCPVSTQEPRFLEEPGSGCASTEQSPITLVQNMVSGLVTTQNTLALVTSMIISRSDSSRRRRSVTYSDPTTRKPLPQGVTSAPPDHPASPCVITDVASSSSEYQTLTVACSSPPRLASSSETVDRSQTGVHASMAEACVVSGLHHAVSQEQVAMTAVTTVTQVVPTPGIQPSFGSIVQVLNPVNIALPGTSILLNDQVNVLAFGGHDPAILQQGLTMPGVGQLHIAPHQSQGQMVVFPTGQGTAMVAIQPSQPALLADFSVEGAGRGGMAEEEEAGVADDRDEGEQMEADEMMRTTGTQTSTPASSFSNCNSLDSGENELEATEVLCPDQSVSSSTREDAAVPTTRDGGAAGIRRVPRKAAAQPTMTSILQQQQGSMSTAQVVVMPSVQQQPFVLPQGVAFAGALGGQGYLQLQQPVDFGFSSNQVGLIHFGQITASGGLIPTTALVGAMSVAGGGVVPTLDRVLAPELPVCAASNVPAKSDVGPTQTFGAAEILHLMSPSLPHGQILVQNMPTFAPFAGTLLPVVPQAAIGTAICNIGGAQTIFAVSQGSLGIVTSVASALHQQPQHPDQLFGDAMPEAPDSTVDSEDAISSNVVDADSVVTSTDAHQTTFVSTETSSRDYPRNANSLSQTRPSSVEVEETRVLEDRDSETTPKESPEFRQESDAPSPSVVSRQVPDDGTSRESELTQNSKDSLLVQAGPSFRFGGEQFKGSAPMKLGRNRKTRKMKRKRHLPSFSTHSSSILLAPSELELQDAAEMSSDFGKPSENVASPRSPAGVESGNGAVVESKREAESNRDNPSKSGSSAHTGFAAASADCHVTTSLSCDSGDSLPCGMKKPGYNRASRLRTKIERARGEHPSFSRGRHTLKRLHVDETSKDERRVADDADSTTSLPSISYPRSFNVGDLVWGPARGFPSWPGKLVPETEVRGNPKTENGKIWVKWFGDHTFTQAEPDQLKTLSEGLETHHNARKKHRKGRRMNANLEAAIQEAMVELDRQMAEQSKQTFGSSTPPDKSTPAKQWSSKRTKK